MKEDVISDTILDKGQASTRLVSSSENIISYNYIFVNIKKAFRQTEEKLPKLFIIHQQSDFVLHYSFKIRLNLNK